MKEIPMLFKDSMVAAIMSGTKTETRRLVFNDDDYPDGDEYSKAEIVYNPEIADPKEDEIVPMTLKGACIQFNDGEHIVKHNYGTEGDVIWVRESWRPFLKKAAEQPVSGAVYDMCIQFRDEAIVRVLAEDGDWFMNKTNNGSKFRWQPNMFLYRRYARTFLKRTFTKVERLQDITEEGAIAEGICEFTKDETVFKYGLEGWEWATMPYTAVGAYKMLWESINGKGSWDLNPWVIVIGFEKIDNYGKK